jgi:hypothetical protein
MMREDTCIQSLRENQDHYVVFVYGLRAILG